MNIFKGFNIPYFHLLSEAHSEISRSIIIIDNFSKRKQISTVIYMNTKTGQVLNHIACK